MRLEHGLPRRRARVEMIPLIDCVFILLVFFIYSMLAMTLQRGIVVQLPEARAEATESRDAVVVTIDAAGALLVNDERVSLAGLGTAVDNALVDAETRQVVVNADGASPHRRFVAVIDELKRRGITRVLILSDEPEAP